MIEVFSSVTGPRSRHRTDDRFFLIASAIMVAVIVAGFARLFLRGISTFAAPWPVHLHALTFMGWVGFFMLQVSLACTGRVDLHRRLGWAGAILIPLLVAIGAITLCRMMRNAAVPPFWTYAYFFAMNMVALISFAVLTIAAIFWRNDTRWHRRLMFCGMAALVITPVNRLLPDAILVQYMSLISAAAILLFPLAGMGADWLRERRIHSAWLWGLGVLTVAGLATEVVGRSSWAGAAVGFITADSPGALVDPFARHLPPAPGL